MARMLSAARKLLVELPDIRLGTTSSQGRLCPPVSQSPKSPSGGKAAWLATRWPDTNSVAAWKASDLGRHSGTHTDGLLHEHGDLRR